MEQENIRYILDNIISKARYNEQKGKYEIKEEDYINLNLTVKQKRLLKIICKNSGILLERTSKILPSKEDEQLFQEYNEIKEKLISNPESKELEQRRIEIRNQIATDNMQLIKTIIDRRLEEMHYIQDIEDIYQMGYEFLLEYIDKNYLDKDTFKNNISSILMLYIHRRTASFEEGIGYRIKDHITSLNKIKKVNPDLDIEELSEKSKIQPKRIEELLLIEGLLKLVSLDEELDAINSQETNDNSPLYDDTFESSLIDIYSREEIVSKIIHTLPKEQREVLILYYGLNDGIDYTMPEIAEIYGLTKARIFAIINKALQKIRTTIRIKYLKEIYEVPDTYEDIGCCHENELEEFLLRHIKRDIFYKILPKVHPTKREFAYLYFHENEYELSQISEVLNIPLTKIYNLKNKITKLFRNEIITLLSQEKNKRVIHTEEYLDYLMNLYLQNGKVRKRSK